MSMGGGGGGETDPLSQAYANRWKNQIFPEARSLYNQETPEFYGGQTYADLSPQTNLGLQQATQTAQSNALDDVAAKSAQQTLSGQFLGDSGQGVLQGVAGSSPYSPYSSSFQNYQSDYNPSQEYLGDMASGRMIGANPYLSGMYDQAAGDITANVNSQFNLGGRYGSGAHTDVLADSLGDMASNLYGSQYQADVSNQLGAAGQVQAGYSDAMGRGLQSTMGLQDAYQSGVGSKLSAAEALSSAYGDERGRQMQGLGLAPQTAQLQYLDPQMMQQVGGVYEAQDQRGIDEAIARHDFEQNAPWDAFSNYVSLSSPQMGGSGYAPQTSETGGIGGAASGALMGSQLGSIVPGIGTGIGALGGSILGGLGLF